MKRTLFLLSCLWTLTAFAQLPKVAAGRIERIENFRSKYVESRNIDVWLPPGYSTDKQYAVLYVHDGQNLFDTAVTYNREEWGMDESMSLLLKNNQIKESIVVGIHNSADRWLEFIPSKAFSQLTIAWQDSVFYGMRMTKTSLKSDNYLRFIVKELKPYIDSAYSTFKDATNTYTMGSSIGGLIALYAVCEYPAVFGGAACLSTHWPGGQMTDHKDNKLFGAAMNNYLKSKAPSPADHRFYFDYGTESLDKFYEPYQKNIDNTLKAKGYDTKNALTLKFWSADHSEKSWAKRLSGPLFFLLKK